MAHEVQLFFDDEAERSIRRLWQRLADAGVPSPAGKVPEQRPHTTLARAGRIPPAARQALRAELSLLSIPDLWLHTLGTFPGDEPSLLLAAVVDTELLAVHSAVHDVLAGKVTNPSAYYFPGAWIPHCPLARGITAEQVKAGFQALYPVEPVRAAVTAAGITDTRTGQAEVLITR
jgi:2'-5' RNA ligase